MKPVAVLRRLSASALFSLLALPFGAHAQTPPAGADYYNIPAALAGAPFNCSAAAAPKTYNCPSISLSKESVLVLTQDVTIKINGAFSAGKELWTTNNGYTLNVDVTGSAAIQKAFNVHMNLTAGGSVSMAKDATLVGNITVGGSLDIAQDATITGNVSAAGNISIGSGGVINGNVNAGGQLDVGSGTTIVGNCSYSSTNYSCQPPAASVHHLRLNHTGSGLTCRASTVTVNACNSMDTNGVCTANTGGIAGNVIAVAANGTTIVATVPFTIASGASFVAVQVPVTSAQQVSFGVNGLTISPGNARTCWNGSSGSCLHDYADSELKFDIPNHLAGESMSVTIQALKKASSQTCAPGFTGARNIQFACTYVNPAPANGTMAPTVNGNSMSSTNAKCDAPGRTVSLTFDNTGTATTTMAYADVGQLTVTATDTQTNITGTDSFIAAPASFTVNAAPATLAAGTDYSFSFTARNTAGVATPAFGKEDTAQAFVLPVLCTPVSTAPTNGVLGTYLTNQITYTAGTASVKLAWAETGTADVKVDMPGAPLNPGYLGSGTGASRSTTSCPLTSLPHHFDAVITQTRVFWYSGQPLTDITVTARSAGGGITRNYAKVGSANVALSAWTVPPPTSTAIPASTGSVTPANVPTAAFIDGIATIQPKFTFTNALNAPLAVQLRATGGDAVNSANTGLAAAANIRRGRLRLSNAFGSAHVDLKMNVTAEYWTGLSWFLNANDNSVVPVSAVALSNAAANLSVGGPITVSSGKGLLVLKNPSKWRGSVDVALNLGNSTDDDVACLPSHPNTTGANLIWLRSRYGSCTVTYDQDPTARASFGLSTPESRATVHFREVFN
jgi:MSHA biogenesis protein MshQ